MVDRLLSLCRVINTSPRILQLYVHVGDVEVDRLARNDAVM